MKHISGEKWLTGRRELDSRLRFSALRADALDDRQQQQWRRLSQIAETNNPFTQPSFIQSSLAHFAGKAKVMLGVVEDEAGWVGVLPFVASNLHGKVPMPHWAAWRHPNMFVGTPLIRRLQARRFWQTLLAGMDRLSTIRMVLGLWDMPVDETAMRELVSVCRKENRPLKFDRCFSRAELSCATDDAVQWKASRRRRIASLKRKLEKLAGPVSFDIVDDPAGLVTEAEKLLELEAAGWKGRNGSALMSHRETAHFFRKVVAQAAQRNEMAMARLTAGDETVALTSFLQRGGQGYGFKMAFDERYRVAAPGMLLLARLTRYLQSGESGLVRFDSCSTPDQEPVNTLWPERREFVDCCIALGGRPRRRLFRTMDAADRLWKSLKAA